MRCVFLNAWRSPALRGKLIFVAYDSPLKEINGSRTADPGNCS
jgi:hypothetical protein